ncbi:hypothetical protein BBJ29_010157, partial [Phytophthora kernoviae]
MSHGGSGGTENTLTLGTGEYITSMEAHWGKKDDHTRVFYLNFVTSAGNSISGGTQTDDKATAIAPDGFQLAGFYGRAEDEVDQLGAIWTRISAVDLSLTDEEASSGSGILYGTTIRNWVGPTIGDATDTACYRKAQDFDSNNICPLGYACLGLPVPASLKFSGVVLVIVEGIVKQAITNGDVIISTGENVLNLLTGTGALNSSTTDMTTTDDLQDLINTNSTCGYELKRLTDRVITSVNEVRNNTPGAAAADVRVIVYKSSIVLNDIPRVTNDCMGELLGNKTNEAAFETRDLLRKTFGVIIDQLIETGTTDMGKDVAQDDYMLKVANMGLVVLSTIDPTGIAYMASQFVQPICGPTAYLGEIDDGTLYDALGLTTVDEAFVGSYGTWAKSGDGVVHLILESVDTEDVSVVVHSG